MLDDVGDLLESMDVLVVAPLGLRNHKKGGLFEEENLNNRLDTQTSPFVHLVRVHDLRELLQLGLHRSDIRNQLNTSDRMGAGRNSMHTE